MKKKQYKVSCDYTLGNVYRVWDGNENYPADMSVEEMDRIAAIIEAALNRTKPVAG